MGKIMQNLKGTEIVSKSNVRVPRTLIKIVRPLLLEILLGTCFNKNAGQ